MRRKSLNRGNFFRTTIRIHQGLKLCNQIKVQANKGSKLIIFVTKILNDSSIKTPKKRLLESNVRRNKEIFS